MTPDPRARHIRPGDRVRVHVNLHEGCFSVSQSGRVIAHVADITLTDVTFHVQPGGLRRIRERRQRAVCAYALGTVTAADTSPDITGRAEVNFNPFKADTFTCHGAPIFTAPEVIFRARRGQPGGQPRLAGWVA